MYRPLSNVADRLRFGADGERSLPETVLLQVAIFLSATALESGCGYGGPEPKKTTARLAYKS